MAMFDFKCDNPSCDFKEEYGISPSFKDPIPEVCPKCLKGKLIKQFPAFNGTIDVVGGYEYQYGKKAFKKNMSKEEYASCLVKGEDGKYKDPY